MSVIADAQSVAFVSVLFAERLPKARVAIAECEDRIGWRLDSEGLCLAVADGASASFLAGEWAQMLVEAYCSYAPTDIAKFEEIVRIQGRAWRAMVNERDLPWYASAKRNQGAFAALIGVTILHDGRWTALASGDSCVFQVRRASPEGSADGSVCLNAFPFDRVGQFGSTPELLATTNAVVDRLPLKMQEFGWIAGDDFYLMSDALAEWFLGEVNQRREPWRWFDALESTSNGIPFARFVDDLRESRKIKDDDIALIHARLAAVDHPGID